MKKVLMCDFCHHTEEVVDVVKMTEHEKTCSFNPINKSCYSCKYRLRLRNFNGCEIDLNWVDGEDDGNCQGWEEKV